MRNGGLVVDFRARPPTPEFLTYFIPKHVAYVGFRLGMKKLPKSYTEGSIDQWFAEADAGGVDRLVVLGRNSPSVGDTPVSNISNEYIAQLVRQYPDRLVGVAGIDVGGEFGDPLVQTRKAVSELDMRAIHIQPTRSALKTHADDRRLYPLYELCLELDVPVVYMTSPYSGPSIEDTHPKFIQQVAVDFPGLNLICGHGCWPYVQEAIGVAFKHANVYLAPDAYIFMPGGSAYVEAANGFMADQMLYGSAYPVGELDACVDAYLEFPWSGDKQRKILGDNAARLLKLKT
jgi:uncharacterized protein